MPYELYKLIHIAGLILLFISLGTSLGSRIADGSRHPWKLGTSITHGISLFLILLGGFGMLARLGLTTGFPGWVWAKIVIWVVMGAALFAAKKMADKGKLLWAVVVVLGILAAYTAIYKPF